jgi:hypothetical protein
MNTQQTLQYAHREEDIATVARAIDALGKKDTAIALAILMAYREELMQAQKPVLKPYDPRAVL